MLSQRTVGRFQRVLTGLFNSVFALENAPLDSGNFYNLLYQEGIHPTLLDYLGNKYSFQPVPITRALHEGEAVQIVGRYLNSSYALSAERAREIGDIYLLVFAAVALRRYEELRYDKQAVYSHDVRGFLESVRQDGYRYQNGHMCDANGSAVVVVPLTGSDGSRSPERKDLQQSPALSTRSAPNLAKVASSNSGTQNVTIGRKWSLEATIAFWGVVVALATLVATVASPEVRRFLHLEKLPPATSESKPLSPAQEADKNRNPQQPGAASTSERHVNQTQIDELFAQLKRSEPQKVIVATVDGFPERMRYATELEEAINTANGWHVLRHNIEQSQLGSIASEVSSCNVCIVQQGQDNVPGVSPMINAFRAASIQYQIVRVGSPGDLAPLLISGTDSSMFVIYVGPSMPQP